MLVRHHDSILLFPAQSYPIFSLPICRAITSISGALSDLTLSLSRIASLTPTLTSAHSLVCMSAVTPNPVCLSHLALGIRPPFRGIIIRSTLSTPRPLHLPGLQRPLQSGVPAQLRALCCSANCSTQSRATTVPCNYRAHLSSAQVLFSIERVGSCYNKVSGTRVPGLKPNNVHSVLALSPTPSAIHIQCLHCLQRPRRSIFSACTVSNAFGDHTVHLRIHTVPTLRLDLITWCIGSKRT